MFKKDFYYDLPPELIAQTPVEPRDSSRLLFVNRESGALSHDRFYNLPSHLREGDLLVFNNSKVFPARLLGVKRGGSVAVEFLLLKQVEQGTWETLVHPGRRLPVGAIVDFGESFYAEITEILDGGNRLAKFTYEGTFFEALDRYGSMPLPHYITEKLADKSRYNTVYAKETGSAAAPTAGLHFTDKTFAELAEKGIETAFVTLHVGLGTFRPVKEENILDHKMHSEHFSVSEEAANKINRAKAQGRRVIAVGTTSCRTLESMGDNVRACEQSTEIFIYPGYEFKVIDGLITNFHLPESTLIMLVSAFLGRDKTMAAYEEAIKQKYRFFSFGDSMIII